MYEIYPTQPNEVEWIEHTAKPKDTHAIIKIT